MRSGVRVDLRADLRAHGLLQGGAVPCLRETEPVPPPEHLLQAVWFHQRLLRDQLRTVDGRRVEILHPGFWNRGRGPDFREALVRFEDGTLRTGDVEIDLCSQNWRGHGHDRNPDYRSVILHVVWEGCGMAEQRPTLELCSVLDAPIAELALWVGTPGAEEFPAALRGRCGRPLGELTGSQVTVLLREAALVRLRAKASQLRARARQAGWEQAFWEGMFRGLGYRQNVWPMQRLGELLPLLRGGRDGQEPERAGEARLLGVAGLLPEELTRRRRGADQFLRELWDSWWREREVWQEIILPRAAWKLSGQRPANLPHRRLALAARWIADSSFLPRIEAWCLAALEPREAPAALLEILQVPREGFWAWHWTVTSPRLARPQALLGMARATDLAMNVILPWLWVRSLGTCSEGGGSGLAGGSRPAPVSPDEPGGQRGAGSGEPAGAVPSLRAEPQEEEAGTELSRELERRYFAWPASEDNAVLRLARRRLLGCEKTSGRGLAGAAAQQGLLQIVRDFCEQSNSVCADCQFPDFVRGWATELTEVGEERLGPPLE